MAEAFADQDDLTAFCWRNGHLEFLLHDSQLVIHNCIEALPPETREAVLLCCRRFGKSYYGCVRALMRCLRWADQRRIVRIIGPDIKQTVGIVEYNMEKITADLNRLGLKGLVNYVKSDKMYQVGKSGIFLGGFDSQEDSLRGGEAHEILIEETGSANADDYNYQMKSVLKPQTLKTRGRMIHLTTLPRVPDHPFVNDTIPAAKLANAFYSYTIHEDPLATPEIVADAIKDCGGVDTIEFKREYLNVETRDPRLVCVPAFIRARHVKAYTLPTFCKWSVVSDWGGVQDKTATYLMTYDFLQDIDLIWDEVVHEPNTASGVIVADIRALEAHWKDTITAEQHVADVPGQTAVDLGQEHNYAVTAPQKSDWKASLNHLNARAAQGKLLIHPRCKFAAMSLESGTLNKQRTDFNRTAALGHCDGIAAAMYGVRCLDRTNPWGETRPSRDHAHVWPIRPENQEIAEAIVGKTFGGAKKFGSFRT